MSWLDTLWLGSRAVLSSVPNPFQPYVSEGERAHQVVAHPYSTATSDLADLYGYISRGAVELPTIPGSVAPTSPQTSASMSNVPGDPDNLNSWSSDQALAEAWSQQQSQIQQYFSELGTEIDKGQEEQRNWLVLAAIAAGAIVVWKI
jgi:hypothetical protein